MTNKNHDLPQLEGSEKQIAWATDIRNGVIETQARLLAEIDEMPVDDDIKAQIRQVAEGTYAALISNTLAGGWIAYRESVNEVVPLECRRELIRFNVEPF